jgi:hypothetical protein
LGTRPKQNWVRRWQRLGPDLLVRLWRHVADNSPATRSRGPWTWGADDRVFKKYGPQLGLVGTWDSGQEHRVRLGIAGLVRLVVIGEGKRLIPVDFTVRRPDPAELGRPCRDTLTWLQVMLERTGEARRRRRLSRPAALVVAARWCGDSKLMAPVAARPEGTWLVEGKSRYVFALPDGQRVTGPALLARADGPWRDSPQVSGTRDARLTASSPTSGPVTVGIVDEPGQDRSSLRCQATTITAPRLIRAWKRRSAIEHTVRTLKHLLAAEACQVPGEAAYYGHLVWRLMASLVLLSTARVVCKGQVTMEELRFSLQHDGRFLDSELLE